MGTVKKDLFIGVLVALFVTFGGTYFYLEYFSKFSFDITFKTIKENNLYGKVLALAAIPNLIIFFIFIKKKQDNKAKGVLIATFLTAFVTLVLKFF